MAVGAVLNHNRGLWALVGAYVSEAPQDIVNLDETLEEHDKNTHFKALVAVVDNANYDLWYLWVTLLDTPIQRKYVGYGRIVDEPSDFGTELINRPIRSVFSSDRELLSLTRRNMFPACTIKTAEAIRCLFQHMGVQELLDCVKELQYGPEYDDPAREASVIQPERGAFPAEEAAEQTEDPAAAPGEEPIAPLKEVASKEAAEPAPSTPDAAAPDNQEEAFDPSKWPGPSSVVPEIRYCRHLEVLRLGRFDDFKGPVDVRGLAKLRCVIIQNAPESPIKESDVLHGPLPNPRTCVLL